MRYILKCSPCLFVNKDVNPIIVKSPNGKYRVLEGIGHCEYCPKIKLNKGSLKRFTSPSITTSEGILWEVGAKENKVLRLDSCRAIVPTDIDFNNKIYVWEVWMDYDILGNGNLISIPVHQTTYDCIESLMSQCDFVTHINNDWVRLDWHFPKLEDLLSPDKPDPIVLRSSLNMKMKVFVSTGNLIENEIFPIPGYEKNPYEVATEPMTSPSGKNCNVSLQGYSYDEEEYEEFLRA